MSAQLCVFITLASALCLILLFSILQCKKLAERQKSHCKFKANKINVPTVILKFCIKLYCIKIKARHFQKYPYLLSFSESDEKIDTAVIFVFEI